MTPTELFFAALANAASIAAWLEHRRYQRLDTAVRNLATRYDRSSR